MQDPCPEPLQIAEKMPAQRHPLAGPVSFQVLRALKSHQPHPLASPDLVVAVFRPVADRYRHPLQNGPAKTPRFASLEKFRRDPRPEQCQIGSIHGNFMSVIVAINLDQACGEEKRTRLIRSDSVPSM